MKHVVCIHLYISWKFGERGYTPRGARRPNLSVCFFVRLFVRHATMLGTESLDGSYTHWTWGNGQKTPRTKALPDKNPPGQKSTRPKVPPGKRPPGKKCPAATYSIAAVAGNWTILVIYATADEADAYVLQMFFLFFFPFATKIPYNRSRERLNEFS